MWLSTVPAMSAAGHGHIPAQGSLMEAIHILPSLAMTPTMASAMAVAWQMPKPRQTAAEIDELTSRPQPCRGHSAPPKELQNLLAALP